MSAMGEGGKGPVHPKPNLRKEMSVSDLRSKRRERRYPRRTWPQALVLLVSVVAALVLALYQFTVPAVVPAGAPATEFSAQRAMEDLEVIADDSSLYFFSRRLAAQKMMFNLIFRDSYVDQKGFVPDPASPIDWLRPAHPRTRWALVARHLDYSPHLRVVCAPTLVLVGRHDPQMPPSCSEELAEGIPDARLVVFEKSGHYPFTE